MAKNIVFCADGTWNGPQQDDSHEHSGDATNVFKLFLLLDGTLATDSLRCADEQEKVLLQQGVCRQVVKYLHGVGDSRNAVSRLFGGAFGAGMISRIVRGYTFISRNYEVDDRIFIVGFSRGAYTARALAGLIAVQGLLPKSVTEDKELAYRRGAEAWYRYRQRGGSKNVLSRLTEVVADLPAFISSRTRDDADYVPVERIAAVAVWDTVGALGIPIYVGGDTRMDAFRFCDTRLSSKVAHGIHAIALDERRCDFEPTLWDDATNVTQMIFAGAHADVGGGYPVANGESGLSDIALGWMTDELKNLGVAFAATPSYQGGANAAGVAHKPWSRFPFDIPGAKLAARKLSSTIPRHSSIKDREGLAGVYANPGEALALYRPENY